MWERGRLVLDGVDLQAGKTTARDEEQDAVIAPAHVGGDQNPVLYRVGDRVGSASHVKVHRRASAFALSGHDCRRDLSPKFVYTREILPKEGQDHGSFLGC